MAKDSLFARHLTLQAQIDRGDYDPRAIQRMLYGTFMPLVAYPDVLRFPAYKDHRLRLKGRLDGDYAFSDGVNRLEEMSPNPSMPDCQASILCTDLAVTSEDITTYCAPKILFQGGFMPLYWVLGARLLDVALVVALDTRGTINGVVHVACAHPHTPQQSGSVLTQPYDTVWPAGTAFILWRPVPTT